jgi:eukaryotic-like serine/threonine-protein kinase
METDRWRRIETIFQAASERAPDEWPALLEARCDGDADLYREVEELLVAHRLSQGILDNPPSPESSSSDDPEALLGTTLDGIYRIERLLGAGGMGAVYLAHHAMLKDRVAIKVLPSAVSANPEWVERFQREGRAARAVHHPNLVTVYELRKTDEGVLYMVQEYVEGRTLREEIQRRGKFSPADALGVIADVASALDAAHEAGVIHRDVKPENVMMGAASAKVLDLGITKLRALDDQTYGRTTNPTHPGQHIGTPAYMAPEQWGESPGDGSDEIDGRADVYSLGVVAYEMVTGQQPFVGKKVLDLWQAHVSDEPRPARDLVPEIPETFSRAIGRALAKDRVDRPESAGQFARELRAALASETATEPSITLVERPRSGPEHGSKRRALAALVLFALSASVAAVALYAWTASDPTPPRTILDVKSVAVLPFTYLGETSDTEYLGLGLTDALITRLGNVRQITVKPTGVVMAYAGAERDYARIGRELGVDALLDGSVQRSGGRVRVTVQLLRVRDGVPIWASTFDEAYTSMFVVQDSISSQMARALTLELSPDEKRKLAEPDTRDAEAYEAYLKGRFFWSKRTEEGLKKSIQYFDQAIVLDNDYALAHAGLAQCYAIYNVYCASRMEDAMPRARLAAESALALNDEIAEAHTVRALVKEQFEYDWPGAEREFKRALEIDPNSATAHQWYSEFLAFRGRTAESLAHIGRAHEIDPISLIITTQQGYPYLCARQHDLAIREFDKALTLDPNFSAALLFQGQAYTQKAMYDEAIERLRRGIALHGRSSALSGRLGYAYAVSGRKNEARAILRDLESGGHASSYDVAGVYVGLGERERAFELLEEAYADRDDRLVLLAVDGRLDALRSDERFADLMRRVGLDGVASEETANGN